MKYFLIAVLFSCGCVITAAGQSKSTVSGLNVSMAMSINETAKSTESQLLFLFTIGSVEQAAAVQVSVRTTAAGTDESSAVFEVLNEKGQFYLVNDNKRTRIINGKATAALPVLSNDPGAYLNKFAVITITDKEGHVSPAQSVTIH